MDVEGLRAFAAVVDGLTARKSDNSLVVLALFFVLFLRFFFFVPLVVATDATGADDLATEVLDEEADVVALSLSTFLDAEVLVIEG